MKILTCSDIHQQASKWKLVVEACEKEKPDILAIAGDICSHSQGLQEELVFFKHILKYAKKIKNMGIEIVITLGNDDNELLIPKMKQAEKNGLWYYIDNNPVYISGYEFVGMSYVPDYPFGYKYWCHPEYVHYWKASTVQYGPVLIDSNNEIVPINNFLEYFKNKQSIWDALIERKKKIVNVSKSIWLIHAPPSKINLDVCANLQVVGSDAVFEFISKYQPMLTIHGHIHEAPEYNGHQWIKKENKTFCIQNGQTNTKLNYSMVFIENNEVQKAYHSKYGETDYV